MSRYFRYTLEDMKKSSDRKLFTYATTFAGGGGSSCGYKLSGGDCKFMNEFQFPVVLVIIFSIIISLLINKFYFFSKNKKQ